MDIIRDGRFKTTQWSLILEAARARPDSTAMDELCARYWYPIYAYVRRSGYQRAEAEDLTQGFFQRLIEQDFLHHVDRSRGRFRWFLLASLKNYLINERERSMAQKRGGGARHFSLDLERGDELYRIEPATHLTPEQLFDRRWAMSMLDAAVVQLREEYDATGKRALFERLLPLVVGDQEPAAQVGTNLGMSAGAVRLALFRLRRRFREVLRQMVQMTVAGKDEIDDELRYLLSAVAG